MTNGLLSDNLHAFVKIIGYGQRDAARQLDSQRQLVEVIECALEEASIRAGSVIATADGEALLITFPAGVNAARVLGRLPAEVGLALKARNQDRAPAARLKLHMAFAMGPTLRGPVGRAGPALTEAMRLSDVAALDELLGARPAADLGMIVTDDLFRAYVVPGFRADLTPDGYTSAQITDPARGADTHAWITLPGQPRTDTQHTPPGSGFTAPRDGGAAGGRLSRLTSMLSDASQLVRAVTALIAALLALATFLAVHFLGGSSPGRPNASPPRPASATPSVRSARSGPAVRPSQQASAAAKSSTAPARTIPCDKLLKVGDGINLSLSCPLTTVHGHVDLFYRPDSHLVMQHDDQLYRMSPQLRGSDPRQVCAHQGTPVHPPDGASVAQGDVFCFTGRDVQAGIEITSVNTDSVELSIITWDRVTLSG